MTTKTRLKGGPGLHSRTVKTPPKQWRVQEEGVCEVTAELSFLYTSVLLQAVLSNLTVLKAVERNAQETKFVKETAVHGRGAHRCTRPQIKYRLAYSDLTAHTEPDWKLTIVFIYSTILSENPVWARQSATGIRKGRPCSTHQ